MTDRYNILTVVLEKATRMDDAESLMDAIRHLRGVLSVNGEVANTGEYMAEERARKELGEKLWRVLYPKA
jgi:hypothetical protein